MRISGGNARGITLTVPKGDRVRPATDGMRQAVFSSLGLRVEGARFLDLFAGSGAYGLEAFSRGAAGGVFVEQNPKAAGCVERNIAAVCKSLGRDPDDLIVRQADARTVPIVGAPPDLVFIDPPYDRLAEASPMIFARLAVAVPPGGGCLVVFEMPGEVELAPEGWTLVKRIGKGRRDPTVCFYRRAAVEA